MVFASNRNFDFNYCHVLWNWWGGFLSSSFHDWPEIGTDGSSGHSLVTELFSFSSGLYAYVKVKLIDHKLGRNLLLFSVPFAILGMIYGSLIPASILKTIFAAGIIFIGY